MTARSEIHTGPPVHARPAYTDEQMAEQQRSGSGSLAFLLFPLIAMAAIAFAAYELVR